MFKLNSRAYTSKELDAADNSFYSYVTHHLNDWILRKTWSKTHCRCRDFPDAHPSFFRISRLEASRKQFYRTYCNWGNQHRACFCGIRQNLCFNLCIRERICHIQVPWTIQHPSKMPDAIIQIFNRLLDNLVIVFRLWMVDWGSLTIASNLTQTQSHRELYQSGSTICQRSFRMVCYVLHLFNGHCTDANMDIKEQLCIFWHIICDTTYIMRSND